MAFFPFFYLLRTLVGFFKNYFYLIITKSLDNSSFFITKYYPMYEMMIGARSQITDLEILT